jgi:hypothetical protein
MAAVVIEEEQSRGVEAVARLVSDKSDLRIRQQVGVRLPRLATLGTRLEGVGFTPQNWIVRIHL